MMKRESGVGSRLLPGILGLLMVGTASAQTIPQLPDSTGWGVHVLALARAPDSAIWAGTYGQGIFVLRPRATVWEHIAQSDDTAKHSISFDFVHAFAFGPKGEVWYGTVGNGWGLSLDNGKSWKNWEYRQLGPEWQYVAPNGIATRGDTTYIATADGLKITGDDGLHWLVVTDSTGVTTAKDSVIGRIRNQYLLALTLGDGANMWVSELTGIAHSPDGGRTWHEGFVRPPCHETGCQNRARAFLTDSEKRFWMGTEEGVYQFGPEFGGWKDIRDTNASQNLIETKEGVLSAGSRQFLDLLSRHNAVSTLLPPAYFWTSAIPLGNGVLLGSWQKGVLVLEPAGDVIGVMMAPGVSRPPSARAAEPLKHTWFRRPIDLADQPYIDQTYRFGSTMGGYFQAHQGVEFNNPDGTPVHAIGDGVVVYSGKAEAGANTIAIRHDRRFVLTPGPRPGVGTNAGPGVGTNAGPGVGTNAPGVAGTPLGGTPGSRPGDGTNAGPGVGTNAPGVAGTPLGGTPGHGPGVNPGSVNPGSMTRGFVFSVYYHNSKLLVKVGDRVKAGDVISLVGNTGRATNDHLHLEVHVAPTTDSSKIVDSDVRYPPFNANPELWIEPLPGTGVVAGQVWDSMGQPVQQVRIYGLAKPEPQETPLSYVETYGPKNHQDPTYHEHFAIGDVPAGDYIMGVTIEGKKVYRSVHVEPGKLAWVEFRPDAH